MYRSAMLLGVLVLGLTPALTLAADKPAPAAAPAPSAGVFTDAQKAAIEEIVRDLLTKKEPDLVVKAAQEMQNRDEAEVSAKSQQALKDNREKIDNDPSSPIAGNPKGDVTLVEFFDYQCGFCKTAYDNIFKVVGEDKKVKFVFKELPILGPNSVQASKAALASVKQGKYQKFHETLMKTKERLSDEVIFNAAKTSGLDVEKLKKDMADESIDKIIKANQALAKEVGAHGTPTFIINDQLYPGAMQYEQLKKAVEDARKNAKK